MSLQDELVTIELGPLPSGVWRSAHLPPDEEEALTEVRRCSF
jgi:hypothetical protein